jgi:hypothetical protein
MFLTIPTVMTWTRIVAIPLIVGVFYLGLKPDVQNLIATVMFVVFAATDWLDGYLPSAPSSTRWRTSSWSALHCWCWCTCSGPTCSWR